MKYIAILITIIISLSCENPFFEQIDDNFEEIIEDNIGDDNDIIIVENEKFNYETSNLVSFDIDTVFSSVPINIYFDTQKRLSVISNRNGKITTTTTIPAYVTEIVLKTDYIGLPQSIVVPLINGEIKYTYFSKDLNNATYFSRGKPKSKQDSAYQTLGSWDNSGVPDYILSNELFTSDFLTVLNSVLPENQPVPENNPQYLSDGAITNISIVEDGEVFVTFVHEGAGYKNVLLFFTYQTNSGIPSTIEKSDLTIIYPNVSYSGSGGGLTSGDTVKIGDFSAGTTIAWALVANGFESDSSVGNGNNTFYSIDELNKEESPNNQHVVQIAFDERVIISFEDLERPYGDNDFNDAIFSVESNPITAIDKDGIVVPEDSPTIDSDGDGIIDTLDSFPNNSNLSAIDYYPSEGNYGTLAYEDLWPHMGDYDFNDLVIDIRIEEYKNSAGDVVSIKAWFLIQGMLASMNNGFAIELGLSPDNIANTTGGEFSRGYIKRDNNGTEKRQSKAVIGIFESAQQHFVENVGTEMVITVEFTDPVTRNDLGYPPYNPFIMSNGERGREVHLPGKAPTDLVHIDYFNSVDDNSVLTSDYSTVIDGDSYKTVNNRPWALNLPSSFKYPKDDVEINQVYTNYDSWVDSDGLSDSDWFLDLNGNINHTLLFIK
ncbi:MAG: LruC domain-containing protein [Spirochaetaceae bacterium]